MIEASDQKERTGPRSTRDTQKRGEKLNKDFSRCEAMLLALLRLLDDEKLKDIQRVGFWKDKLKELQKTKFERNTKIAVIGETGEGKSSLINALIDKEGALPTSGMEDCTTVVVEISSNDKEEGYEATIDFLEREEWEDELKLLLDECTENGKKKPEASNNSTEEGKAYNKLEALYGHMESLDFAKLSKDESVTCWYGKTKTETEIEPEEFYRKLDKYIEKSKGQEDQEENGFQFWPIVKKVSIKLPKCEVVSNSAVLVDLPGIGGSNKARDNVVRKCLNDCTDVWIVASIHRAISKNKAREMIEDNFSHKLFMDGRYDDSLTYVCTKRDIFNEKEVIRELGLGGKCKEIDNDIKLREKEKVETNKSMKILNEAIKTIEDQVFQIENENSGQEEKISELIDELGRKEIARQKMENEFKKTEIEIKEKKQKKGKMIAEMRDIYCTEQIKSSFKEFLKNKKREASLIAKKEDISEEDEDRKIGKDEDLVNSFNVRCVSSWAYQKIKDEMAISMTLEETGIPQLREDVTRKALSRLEKKSQRYIAALGVIVLDIQQYLTDNRTQINIRKAVEEQAVDLKLKFKEVLNQLSTKVTQVLVTDMEEMLIEGVRCGFTEAPGIPDTWAFKGLHWKQYMSVAKRLGYFKSPTSEILDFNSDLAVPMYVKFDLYWLRVFSELLRNPLIQYKFRLRNILETSGTELCKKLNAMEVPTGLTDNVLILLLHKAGVKLEEMINILQDMITYKQREISTIPVSEVKEHMTESYTTCTNQSGKGTLDRIQRILKDGVEEQKDKMYKSAYKKILEEMKLLKDRIVKRFATECSNLCEMLISSFEPMWQQPENLKLMKEVLFHDVKKAADEMKRLHDEYNLPIPDILISDSAIQKGKKQKFEEGTDSKEKRFRKDQETATKTEVQSDLPQEKWLNQSIEHKIHVILRKNFPKFSFVVLPYRKADPKDAALVFIAYSEDVEKQRTEILGFPVLLRNPKLVDRKSVAARNYEKENKLRPTDENLEKANKVIDIWGEGLWKMHSNLNVITVAGVKSRTNGYEAKLCIVLLCSSKGYIPVGEKPFPNSLKTDDIEIDVDVREGFFEFGPATYPTDYSGAIHRPLRMGCRISMDNAMTYGTMGPFVDLGNGKTGFLTCAHVLFTIDQQKPVLDYDQRSGAKKFDVRQPAFTSVTENNHGPCGCVMKAIFKPHLDVSVDAAVVEITDDNCIPDEGLFALDDVEKHKHIGFVDMPKFNNGTVCSDTIGPITNRKIVKFGSESHLTQGMLNCYGIQVRPLGTVLGLSEYPHRRIAMKKQIAVEQIGAGPFFIPGDSGSGVFVKEDNGTLHCIGIAIGRTSEDLTVVTPIREILSTLQINGLKKFPEDMSVD